MAMSIKKVENPVTQMSFICRTGRDGRTRRRVFFFERKWDAITRMEMTVPIAVARPAPKAPMSQTNTKK